MKILIVDDEQGIREVIKEYCLLENYEVIEAENGREAIEKVKENNIDLIVLDIMMPKLDGYSTLKEIKEIKNIPVILLSARKEEFDKLMGFNLGSDDYMTKPFSPRELIARIKAILKRTTNEIDEYKFDTLKVDFKGHTLTIDDKEIKITPKEFDLLTYFIKNPNIALSREQLLNKIWGYDFYGDDRTIDTHIKMLRNNLKQYRNLIVTVRGMGYKFEIKK
ncbi:MAG: response regulator transcription factor [Bacilli bacterium]